MNAQRLHDATQQALLSCLLSSDPEQTLAEILAKVKYDPRWTAEELAKLSAEAQTTVARVLSQKMS